MNKDKIKKELDIYLEFDSDLIFKTTPTVDEKVTHRRLIRIFGGSLRDIIAEKSIKDIDILVGSKSISSLERILTENGYVYMDSLTPKDINSMYSDLKILSEPHTWIKSGKIVQLIRPSLNGIESAHMSHDILEKKLDNYEKSFINLIQNVDISCCGLSYDGYNLYENYKDAVLHCRSLLFEVNKKAIMYNSKRIDHRINKLLNRGWDQISNISDYRDIKINRLLSEDFFIPEYRTYEI
jgi:predicted nucleotidyltransferase